jgi:hypothetical protein
MSDLSPEEKELVELRARRAEVAERRARLAEQATAQLELEKERRALADDEAIARLEEEHGAIDRAIAVVQTDHGAVVLRRAKPPAYKRFNEYITRDNAKTFELSEQLVVACLLYPTREAFATMAELQPFIMIRCANAISTLAGVRVQEVQGK